MSAPERHCPSDYIPFSSFELFRPQAEVIFQGRDALISNNHVSSSTSVLEEKVSLRNAQRLTRDKFMFFNRRHTRNFSYNNVDGSLLVVVVFSYPELPVSGLEIRTTAAKGRLKHRACPPARPRSPSGLT